MADDATRLGRILEALAASLIKVVANAVKAIMKLANMAVGGRITPKEFGEKTVRVLGISQRAAANTASAAYQRVMVEAGAPRQNVLAIPVTSELPKADIFDGIADSSDTVEESWEKSIEEVIIRWNNGDETIFDEFEQAIEDEVHIAVDDTTDIVRDASYQNSDAGNTIIGYRRVVHPERNESGQSCGLCVVASTRIYKKSNLRPIHDNCKCEVVPVTLTNDPGDSLNRLDLGDLYEAAANSNTNAALKRVRVNSSGTVVVRRNPRKSTLSKQGKKSVRAQQTNVWDDIDWVRHQLTVTKNMPSSQWRTNFLRKLETRLTQLAA